MHKRNAVHSVDSNVSPPCINRNDDPIQCMVLKFLLAALGALSGGFGVMLVSVAIQSYILLLAGMAASGAGVLLLVQGSNPTTTPSTTPSDAAFSTLSK